MREVQTEEALKAVMLLHDFCNEQEDCDHCIFHDSRFNCMLRNCPSNYFRRKVDDAIE